MTTIASGVAMRIGTYDTAIYPDRQLRHVNRARKHETIAYRIESDDYGIHHVTPLGEKWDHYRYRFHYRHLGRTFSVRWSCGTGYGDPKPLDGLVSAFQDAEAVEWEAFGSDWAADLGYDIEDHAELRRAERVYNACERMNNRLEVFLGVEREVWKQATENMR